MTLDFYPLIRQFLNDHPGAAISIDTRGRPLFRDWLVRSQFFRWLRLKGHELNDSDLPIPGHPAPDFEPPSLAFLGLTSL